MVLSNAKSAFLRAKVMGIRSFRALTMSTRLLALKKTR
jgi:hypothetical protein